MSNFTFQKAQRQQTKVRAAVTGPSGAGKTHTSLTLARELAGPGGKVAVIDTERGSASLYAQEFDFDVLEFPPPYDPRLLVQAMQSAEPAGYDVIVIDSSTHFYKGEGGTLDIADQAGKRSGGNTYVGWKDATPIQDAFYAAVRNAGCHVLATMRSKTEYVLETNAKGKQAPVKRGMAAEQRAGAEYEFDFVLDLEIDHHLVVGKTRANELADKVYAPGDAVTAGQDLRAWSLEGSVGASDEQVAEIRALTVELGLTPEQVVKGLIHFVKVSAMDKLTPEKADEFIKVLSGKAEAKRAKDAAAFDAEASTVPPVPESSDPTEEAPAEAAADGENPFEANFDGEAEAA